MKVLVTGGTGFTGSHLVRHLLEAGHEVRVLARSSSLARVPNPGSVEAVEGDVRDLDRVRAATKGVERVFHLAALFREAGFRDEVYRAVNVTGTENVLRASAESGVARLVHCSTIGVHGSIDSPPADETAPFKPGDVYQRSKLEAEELAVRFSREQGLPLAVVRPAMIWGEGDLRFLKLFRAIARRRFIMVGDGQTMFHFVHIDDLCRGFLLAAEKPEALGEAFIFAGREQIRIDELVSKIARAIGVPPPRWRIPAWPVQALGTLVETVCVPLGIEPPIYRRRVDFFTKHRAFSIDKARRRLGYSPRRTVDEEIESISSWYRANRLYD